MCKAPEARYQPAYYYFHNHVPFPRPLVITKEYIQEWPEATLRCGLEGLHRLMSSIYQSAALSPGDFVIPGPSRRSKAMQDLPNQVFVSIPSLLYVLGLGGRSTEVEGQFRLEVDRSWLEGTCLVARIKDYEKVLVLLGRFGIEALPSTQITIRFCHAPEIAVALPVFAKACRHFVKKDAVLPLEFGRIDMRVMAFPPGKKKAVPVELEESIRLLDEKQAAFLTALDAWAKSSGYRAEVKYGTLHNAAWRANYRSPKLGKTLYGFSIDDGELSMHVNLNQAERILPHILEMPAPFKALYFEKCACADCGGCETGPLVVEVAGKLHKLCNYSYLSLPEIPIEFHDPVTKLLQIQDGFLKQDAQI